MVKDFYPLVIIGAGPAGLMAALSAHAHGLNAKNIAILEAQKQAGKKLRLSGKGRCNFSQDLEPRDFSQHYYGQGKFLYPAFQALSPQALLAFFVKRGLPVKKDGLKLYPASENAQDVLNLFLKEIKEMGIPLFTEHKVERVAFLRDRSRFRVEIQDRPSLEADRLIVASGGKSFPFTGSQGFAFDLATAWNLPLTTPAPALAGIILEHGSLNWSQLAGLSLQGIELSLHSLARPLPDFNTAALNTQITASKALARQRGDLLFTHRGLSGPAALNISREISRRPGQELLLRLNLLSQEGSSAWPDLALATGASPRQKTQNMLKLILPAKLVNFLCEEKLLSPHSLQSLSQSWQSLTLADISALGEDLQAFNVAIKGTEDFNKAMLTTGGLKLSALERHSLRLKTLPQLYFCGECLDIDGECGGFNLQAAFSTAFLAGKSAAESLS